MQSKRIAILTLLFVVGVAIPPRARAAGTVDPGRFVTVDSTRIWYEMAGEGSAVVLLHDGLLPSVTWDAVWPALCSHHRVVRYDRRGLGQSDSPRHPFLPTEDLDTLLTTLGIRSATLVGSSSGAGLAIDFAIRHPERVERLVLVGPVLHGMASSQHFLDRGARNNAPLARGDVRGAARRWADDPWQIGPGNGAARQVLFRELSANSRDLTYDGRLELHFAIPAADRIGEIRMPTLVLVGESDIADVQAYAGAIELGLPGSLREVVVGAGHLVQLEQPEFLARRIEEFIVATPRYAIDPDRLAHFAGHYDSLLYGRAGDIRAEAGRLVVHAATERPLPIFAADDSSFYGLGWGGVRFVFRHGEGGTVKGVGISQHGASRFAPRIG